MIDLLKAEIGRQRVAFITVIAGALVGCSEQDYAIVSESDFPSPDGTFIATIVEDTYFNTTGYEKQVSVRHQGEKRPPIGNVWGYGPGDMVSVEWTSTTGLVIHYTYETPRPGPSHTNIYGLAVTFKETCNP